jgi:5-methylcytosine-specific restriction endonuclease McrA
MVVWSKCIGKVWEGKCMVCDIMINCTDFHVGHVVAHARGGTDHVDNLRPICAQCNMSMGTQNLNEYRDTYYGGAAC